MSIRGSDGSSSIFKRNCRTTTRRCPTSSGRRAPHRAFRISSWPSGCPARRASATRSLYSVRVSLTAAPSFFHAARFRVYDEAARLDHPVLRHIAQRRAHARQKLAYDKRLLQIIIGARIERQDFFRLAVARRYDNDRDGERARILRMSFLPSMSGSPRSRTTMSDAHSAIRTEGFLSGRGVKNLVPARRQRGPQEFFACEARLRPPERACEQVQFPVLDAKHCGSDSCKGAIAKVSSRIRKVISIRA